MTGLVWRTSSRCEAASCLRWAEDGHYVLVRDDDNPGVELRVPRASWAAFVAGIRAGDGDVLMDV